MQGKHGLFEVARSDLPGMLSLQGKEGSMTCSQGRCGDKLTAVVHCLLTAARPCSRAGDAGEFRPRCACCCASCMKQSCMKQCSHRLRTDPHRFLSLIGSGLGGLLLLRELPACAQSQLVPQAKEGAQQVVMPSSQNADIQTRLQHEQGCGTEIMQLRTSTHDLLIG